MAGRALNPGLRMLGRLGAIAVATATLLLATGGPALAAGGPVILGGDDLTAHGGRDTTTNVNEDGWLYIEKALENLLPNVTRPGNNGSIAALGSADSTSTFGDAGAAIHFAAQDAGGIPVTYYNGGPAIEGFFDALRAGTTNPAIIWIAGDDGSNDLSDDSTEPTALSNNATTIGDFVNSGGGLMSHGAEYGWLFGLFPGASTVEGGGDQDLVLTPAGQAAFPGLTNPDVNAGPWHNHFEGNLGSLAVLVESNVLTDSQGNPARVIVGGGAVVLPGSITLDPAAGAAEPGTDHTVTATVRNDVGALLPGATVTFNVVSGPNTGETGTAVTGANGEATFTWTGDGGPGTDTIEASFVDAGGATRTTSATVLWTVAIPVIPMAGIPVALATVGLVGLLWARRRRQLATAG